MFVRPFADNGRTRSRRQRRHDELVAAQHDKEAAEEVRDPRRKARGSRGEGRGRVGAE